jgi:2-polyprenyl-6-hydroxyphenyl methylase/3-demethylubiquinone-9 3-methyltransferase
MASVSESRTRVDEVEDGARFEFGENWNRFLNVLDETRIAEAERSLCSMLGREDLNGLSFLDVGSGSGLFSLAAARLGADRVHSFDFDPSSVRCTEELKRRFGPSDASWTIELGSALDCSYLESLGTFDVVYSWGVLHHTGDLWSALDNVTHAVVPEGQLFISIYNDQGLRSDIWTKVKQGYNALPARWQRPYVIAVMAPREGLSALYHAAQGRPRAYFDSWRNQRARGMSRWHDLIDWVGGYPFEVARPEQVFSFVRARGFELERLKTCRGGLGCNEFVFVRKPG